MKIKGRFHLQTPDVKTFRSSWNHRFILFSHLSWSIPPPPLRLFLRCVTSERFQITLNINSLPKQQNEPKKLKMWWLCSKIALRKGKIFFLHVSSCEWRRVRGEGTGAIWNIAQRLSSVWKVQGEVDEFCFLVIIHGQWSSFSTLEGLQLIISRRSINNHIEFIPLQSAILHSNWQGRFAFSKNRLYAYNESGAPENYRSIYYTESIDRRLNCSKSIDERWEVLLKLMKIPICNSKGMVYSDEFFSNKVKMISSNLWSSNPIWHVCHRDFG